MAVQSQSQIILFPQLQYNNTYTSEIETQLDLIFPLFDLDMKIHDNAYTGAALKMGCFVIGY